MLDSKRYTTSYGNVNKKIHVTEEAPPFCNCMRKIVDRRLSTIKIMEDGCECGESEGRLEWGWNVNRKNEDGTERDDVVLDGQQVTFHPVYSQGTAVMKGEIPLEHNMHHYWEVKIMSFLTGTDMLIGIGTDKVDIHSHHYSFTSFLGLTDQSWGYSYRGLLHNNNRLKYYGKKFSKGCIIGVHLDLHRGCIEYYLNRRPLGIAYTNIPMNKDIKIYPMVCSTSARTTIKLINSQSFTGNLQFLSVRSLSRDPEFLKNAMAIPGLKRLCQELWYLQCKEKYQYQSDFEKNNLLLEDEAIMCSKKKKYVEESDTDDSLDSLNDLYKNAHRIKHFKRGNNSSSSSDDEDDSDLNDEERGHLFAFFCNHFQR